MRQDQARNAGPEGEVGYAAFLRERARTLGVEHRVLFLGPLYGVEKRAALVDADVFALPSRYENLGNTAAEAIACGTPVMCRIDWHSSSHRQASRVSNVLRFKILGWSSPRTLRQQTVVSATQKQDVPRWLPRFHGIGLLDRCTPLM